jgi:hypothetical protein
VWASLEDYLINLTTLLELNPFKKLIWEDFGLH